MNNLQKIIVLLSLMSFAKAWSAPKCIDLSGTYEFNGFGTRDCKINNDSIMHISPLPLGSVIHANRIIKIEQKGCEQITLAYKDDRYSNTQDVEAKYPIDMKTTNLTETEINFSKVDSGTVCYMGCLTSRDSTSWKLELDSNKNLKMSFKHSSYGLFNYILPTIDIVKAKCVMERI